jgi:hypothetical protein
VRIWKREDDGGTCSKGFRWVFILSVFTTLFPCITWPSFLLIEIFTDFLVPLLLTFLSLKKYLLIFIVFLNKLLFKSVILALSCMTCLVALKSSTLNISGSLCPLYCIVLNNWQDWTVNEFNLCSWIYSIFLCYFHEQIDLKIDDLLRCLNFICGQEHVTWQLNKENSLNWDTVERQQIVYFEYFRFVVSLVLYCT